MKIKKQILRIVLSSHFLFSFFLLNAQGREELRVGDSAPKLQISNWLKGNPVPEFKKDDNHIYIVYFTGTWCPPCRKSIPHLTGLQKKYNNLMTLVSVYMEYGDSEDANSKRVTNLMEALDDKMDFTIALDDISRSNMSIWGVRGPTLFIVRAGRIIWRGDSRELDPVLEQLAAGTFDAVVAQHRQQEYKERLNNIYNAKAGGDFQSALAGIDRLIKEAEDYPLRLSWLYYQKFKILAGDDDKGAYEWLQWILDNRVQGFDWPHFVVSALNGISRENRNYELELKAIDRTIEESETKDKTAFPLMIKSMRYDRMGDYQKSIRTIRKAINVAEEVKKEVKRYKDLLTIYTYKAQAKKDSEKASAWLRQEIDNKRIQIDYYLINATMEVDPTFALELIDNAPAELDKGTLIRYKNRILTSEYKDN